MTDLHNCAIAGCSQQIKTKFMMCREHWAMVPPSLRREILYRWARLKSKFNTTHEDRSTPYRVARAEAIRIVAQTLETNMVIDQKLKEMA